MRKQRQTHGEEVANVLTHGAGMLFGLTAIVVLMIAGIRTGDPWVIGSFAVYALCMTSSYVTSTFTTPLPIPSGNASCAVGIIALFICISRVLIRHLPWWLSATRVSGAGDYLLQFGWQRLSAYGLASVG